MTKIGNSLDEQMDQVAKTIKARKLWADVGHAAWACADPGIQFHDTVTAWHTCLEDGEIRGSNPCSEYMFLMTRHVTLHP